MNKYTSHLRPPPHWLKSWFKALQVTSAWPTERIKIVLGNHVCFKKFRNPLEGSRFPGSNLSLTKTTHNRLKYKWLYWRINSIVLKIKSSTYSLCFIQVAAQTGNSILRVTGREALHVVEQINYIFPVFYIVMDRKLKYKVWRKILNTEFI